LLVSVTLIGFIVWVIFFYSPSLDALKRDVRHHQSKSHKANHADRQRGRYIKEEDADNNEDVCDEDDPSCGGANDEEDDDGEEEEDAYRERPPRHHLIKNKEAKDEEWDDEDDDEEDTDTAPEVQHDVLAFFLQSKEGGRIKKVSSGRLDFLPDEKAVDAAILGYLRSRLAAEEVAQRIDWVAVADTMAAEEMAARLHGTPTQFENPLYLASASPYSPYFVLNFPLLDFLNAEESGSETTPKASGLNPGDLRQRRLQQRSREKKERPERAGKEGETLETLGLTPATLLAWKEVIRGRAGADYKPTSRDAFPTSPIHNAAAVGYYKEGFLARNLYAIGFPTGTTPPGGAASIWRQETTKTNKASAANQASPRAEILFVEYDAFLALVYELHEEMTFRVESAAAAALVSHKRGRGAGRGQSDDDVGSSSSSASASLEACVCGPHVGLARHIVAFLSAGSKAPHVAVYIEPIIVSAQSGADISRLAHPTESLRSSSTKESGSSDRRQRKDQLLRRQFRWKPKTNTSSTTAPNNRQKEGRTEVDAYDRYVLADALLTARLQDLNGSYFLPFEPDIRVDFLLVEENPAAAAAADKASSSSGSSTSKAETRRERGHRRSRGKPAGPPTMVNQGGRRSLQQVKGQEALCIQYCQYMAYAMRDQMRNETIPSEQLLLPSADDSLPPSSRRQHP
jgi:hypothetical protein